MILLKHSQEGDDDDVENVTANWTSSRKDTLKVVAKDKCSNEISFQYFCTTLQEDLSSLQEIIEKGNIYRKEPKILITSAVDDNESQVLHVPKGSTSSAPDRVSVFLALLH